MRLFPTLLAGLVLLSGQALAEAPLPPLAQTQIDALSAALAGVEREGKVLHEAARRLRAQVDADPSLAPLLRDRLRTMLEATRPGVPPEVQGFLLPYILLFAAPGSDQSTSLGRLRFRAAEGEPRGEAFLARPDRQAQSQDFVLEWTSMAASPLAGLGVTLDEAVHFAIAAQDCPGTLSGTGSCTLTVRFAIAGNGVRQDMLTARFGGQTARVHLSGQGSGFPPADPEILVPAETIVRLDPALSAGDGRIRFTVVNHGPGALPPFAPRLWSREAIAPKLWDVDRSSTCTTATTAAGESCALVMAFNPTRNEQESALFTLPDPAGKADVRKRGEVFGYARGFAEALPAGLLGNGDPCPPPGGAADVVLHRDMRGPYTDEAVRLDTLSCGAWQLEDDGMRCADPGSVEGGTRRFWTRAAVDAPWRLSSVIAVPVEITCREGRIERIVPPPLSVGARDNP